MKLWKKILIVVLILCAILVICIARKFIIITNLVNVSKEYDNKTNYLAVIQSLQNGNVNIAKSYNKDGNYLTTLKTYGKDIQDERGLIKYKKDNEELAIVYSGKEKIALLNQPTLVEISVVNVFSTFNEFLPRLQLSAMSKITTDNYGSIECYLIELYSWKMWVEKDTGLIIRELNGGMVSERIYEFDVVKDEDIIKPDISDCKMQE